MTINTTTKNADKFTQFNIKSSIGETVKGTVDFLYGTVDTVGTSVSGITPIGDGINFPYTFSHASIELLDGTTIAEVQDIDFTLAANTELLYQQGSPNAAGSFRKLFEMTCKFNASFIDKAQLQRVPAR